MIWPTRSTSALALVCLAAWPLPVHSQTAEATEQVVLRNDSLVMVAPALSPDARWLVVSGGADNDRSNLFVAAMPDGELRPLTRGRFNDMLPRWAPDGRTLYFLSDRIEGPEAAIHHVFRLPFDPATGEATGVPRPVSLEPAAGRGPFVSPDGTRLAFGTTAGTTGRRVLVVPASGGAATVVVDGYRGGSLGWTPDGREVLFMGPDPDSDGSAVYRVSADGGELALHLRSDYLLRDVSVDGRRYLWRRSAGFGEQLRVTDESGSVLATFEPRESSGFWPRLSPDGRSVMTPYWAAVSPIVVAPLAGGPGREFGEPGGYHYPLGFSRDGRVLTGDEDGLLVIDPASGERTELGIPATDGPGINERLHPDGGHILLSRDVRPESDRVELWIHDLGTGEERRVSDRFARLPRGSGTSRVTGRGGRSMLDGDRFLFLEHESTGVRVKSVTPTGTVETLTELPRHAPDSIRVGVHGSRVAWIEPRLSPGDSSWALIVRDVETGTDRTVLDSETLIFDPVWSNDGGRIVLGYSPAGSVDYDVGIVDLDDATPSIEVRDAGAKWWWSPKWTADDARVIVVGMAATSTNDTDVWMIQVDNGATPPVPLVDDVGASTWEFVLSYDGRRVAYHVERPGTSEILRYTIGH